MAYFYYLVGLDTLELIRVGHEKSPAMRWGLWDHEGPVINLRPLGYGDESKFVMLPKKMLEDLYARFAAANPKGTRLVVEEGFLEFAPPGLTREKVRQLYEDEKLFPDITADTEYSRLADPKRVPRLCKLLPELLSTETLAALANDPEIDLALMARAYKEGDLSPVYGERHKRWSPEWAAHVEAYKKAHQTGPN